MNTLSPVSSSPPTAPSPPRRPVGARGRDPAPAPPRRRLYDLQRALVLDRVPRARHRRRAHRVPALGPAARPAPVNDDDLAYAKVRLDARSLATSVGRLPDFPLPPAHPRLRSAWDMTRDGELPAREFIDLVLDNIAFRVDDPSVAQDPAPPAEASALAFLRRPRAPHRHRRSRPPTGCSSCSPPPALPGSDAQLRLFSPVVRRARALPPPAAQRPRVMLDGSVVVDGLAVDAEMRWALLGALAAGGAVGRRRDRRRADPRRHRPPAGSRPPPPGPPVPTAEAKELAWAAGGRHRGAAEHGTGRGDQRLLPAARPPPRCFEPFVERYFAALVPVWSRRAARARWPSRSWPGCTPRLLAEPRPAGADRDRWLAEADAESPRVSAPARRRGPRRRRPRPQGPGPRRA